MRNYRKRLLGLLVLTFVVSSAMILFFDSSSTSPEKQTEIVAATTSGETKNVETIILESFSTGNAELLSSYFSKEVNLTILNQEEYYDAVETVSALQSFFEKDPPKTMLKKHDGVSKHGDGAYLIAILSTTGGSQYRCHFFMEFQKITSIEIRRE